MPEENDKARVDAAIAAAILKDEDPIYAFQPLDTQKAVLESETKVTVAFGGNRSGKSDTGAVWAISMVLSKPNRKFWCVTVDEPLSIRVQQAKIHNMLPRHLKTPPADPELARKFYYNYNPTTGYVNNKFTLANGTSCEMKFYSQDVKSFQGEDLDGIWFDETPSKEIWDESTVRLWDRHGIVLITCTATEGITAWVRTAMEGIESRATRYHALARKHLPVHQYSPSLAANIYYLWTLDNPHIDQEAVMAKAKTYAQSEIELRLFGVPSNLQGLIYPSFSTQVHVRPLPSLPSPPAAYWIHALDPHDRKPWCLGWYVFSPPEKTLYVVDEYPDVPFNDKDVASHLAISDYVRVIKMVEERLGWGDTLDGRRPRIFRLIDPNKGRTQVVGATTTETVLQMMARRGYYYSPANDALTEGHMQVRELLYFDPTDPISATNHPRLYFGQGRTQNHVKQFCNYEFADHATEEREEQDGPKEAPKLRHKDFPDLVRYVALFLKNIGMDVSTVETTRRRRSRR